jgi:DNA-binding NarL/FixJ family response regulator
LRRTAVLCAYTTKESRTVTTVFDDRRTLEGPIRILIVEDQLSYACTLTMLLGLDPRLEVVGHASDGVDGIAQAEHLRPDVVLMDVHMPRLGGIEAAWSIAHLLPRTTILMLTSSCDPEDIDGAFEAGASGYLLKDSELSELVRRILDAAPSHHLEYAA